ERYLQWVYGIAAVNESPLIGIGYVVYERAEWMSWSTDSFWLFWTVTLGYPATAFLVGAVAFLGYRMAVHKVPDEFPVARIFKVSWLITLLSLCISAITVHFWGMMHVHLFFMIGAGMWLLDLRKPKEKQF
ncbi:hypothetical protein, partial [Pontibacterium sp.]|uniref:hypothetical protein n=1 Tax=Pontibacterium sp. TaxID=2036026 RepID=UPI00356B1352